MTVKEKIDFINEEIKNQTSKNPIEIAETFMDKPFINIHGPEHHYLDGASFLIAFFNAGGNVNIDSALLELEKRTLNMPGAMCGQWGVCGSATAIGASLSIINHCGPLTNNDFYKHNMELTSTIISQMSKIGGPRCCKRNAFISISNGVHFVKEKYAIEMTLPKTIKCKYSPKNKDCIEKRCPFFNN